MRPGVAVGDAVVVDVRVDARVGVAVSEADGEGVTVETGAHALATSSATTRSLTTSP